MNLKKNEKGITLIALVITIIVLLILAGVAISMLTGDNGILTQAGDAKEKTEEALLDEKVRLFKYESEIDKYDDTEQDEGDRTEIFLEELVADGLITKEEKADLLAGNAVKGKKSLNDLIVNTNAKTVANYPEKYYGKSIKYVPDFEGAPTDWQIFHSDGTNIYLISEDYINHEQAPMKGTKEVKKGVNNSGYNTTVNISEVASVYETIQDIQAAVNPKWIDNYFLTSEFYEQALVLKEDGKSLKSVNMQAVAYLQDQEVWGAYKDTDSEGKGYAEYAMGAAPLQLFLDSYNKTHPGINITTGLKENEFHGVYSISGYMLSLNGGSLVKSINTGLPATIQLEDNRIEMYIDTSTPEAYGYWLASPNCLSSASVESITTEFADDGSENGGLKINCNYAVNWTDYTGYKDSLTPRSVDGTRGLRPIICLKSDVIIEEAESVDYDFQFK